MSFTIIDANKKAPILEYEPVPMFKTSVEQQRYWEREKQRWMEGYNGLPGTFYYAVQQAWVKNRVSGVVARYEARESGLLIHEFVKNQRARKRMGGIVKGRGVGLSTEFGILCNYFMRNHPGSTSIVTSKDIQGISTIFSDKILPCYYNIESEVRPTEIKKSESQKECYLRVAVPSLQNGEVVVSNSEIYCRETSERPSSATNLSGKGAIFGCYDEFPLHKRRREVLKSSIECYRNQTTKELDGFLLWGGTVEEELSGADLIGFRDMVNDSSLWDCDILFLPFWQQMYLENGRPDRERAEKWWDGEFEKLSKATDKSLLTAFIRNNPRSLDDIFETTDGDRWESDVTQLIKEQKKIIINSKPERTVGIFMNYDNNISFVPEKGTPFVVLEQPKPNIVYYEVIDGVATGTDSGGEKGSSVAGLIVKGYDSDGGSYKPVAMYFERPKTVETSYISLTNMAIYYNRYEGLKGIMAEANAGTADHFATFLQKKGMGKYIMSKQNLYGAAKSGVTAKPFVYVTIDVRDWQIKQANLFLRKYIQNITLIELLEQMLESMEANTDILDAWLMLFLALPPDFDAPVREKEKKKRMIRVYERDKSGRVSFQWKQV